MAVIMALPTRVNRGMTVDPIEALHREFDQTFGRWLGRDANGGSVALFPVDVREDGDHLYVEADLPGFSKDDINITLENSTLTITAEKSLETKEGNGSKGEQKGDYLLQERRYSRLQRSFTLPPSIDGQTVQAKLEDGVLKIVLNRREETKPRKITVN